MREIAKYQEMAGGDDVFLNDFDAEDDEGFYHPE